MQPCGWSTSPFPPLIMGCDFLPAQCAQFRQVGQQCHGQLWPQAGNAAQEFILSPPHWTVLYRLSKFAVQVVQLLPSRLMWASMRGRTSGRARRSRFFSATRIATFSLRRCEVDRTYCRVSGVAELYNLRAISRSDLRRCRHVELHCAKNSLDHRRRMGGSDPRGDNPVHVGRHGSGRRAGSQPADSHDDAAVHGGDARSRHWRGNGHRVVAEPPAGCQGERLKW